VFVPAMGSGVVSDAKAPAKQNMGNIGELSKK
jgi:hypothetical protein